MHCIVGICSNSVLKHYITVLVCHSTNTILYYYPLLGYAQHKLHIYIHGIIQPYASINIYVEDSDLPGPDFYG